ncbi:MAG: thioredoxin family protein, partial [Pyrinomonadaceae bacterium]|nr:thioredoxin family protein [Pyrinomonadaceae bacterium]
MPGGVDYNALDVKDAKVVQTFKAARENDRNVLVIFDAVWCGVCRKFNGQTMKDPQVRKTLAEYEVINIDVDKFPEPTNAFGKRRNLSRIESVPTIMIFSSEGIQTDEFTGFYNGKRFNRILKRNL